MFNLTEVMLVKMLLEWDIHATPVHLASFNFKNMGFFTIYKPKMTRG